MTEKELLYVEDAVNHELYMIQLCTEIIDCLTDEELVKNVKKMKTKHESLLKKFLEIL